MKREVVGHRIAKQEREDRHPGRDPHGAKQSLQVNIHVKQLAVIVQSPGANDGLRRRNGPEAVTEKKRVRNEQEHSHPQQGWYGDRDSIGAGEHQLVWLPSVSRDCRTGTASAAENSRSRSSCQFFRLAHLTVRTSPSMHSTCNSSVAPWNAWRKILPRKRSETPPPVPSAIRMFSGRREKRPGPSRKPGRQESEWQRATPSFTSPLSRLVWPMNWAV